MGKLPASLLSIVFQLYLIDTVFADEQVRKVQEQLRKRHLFYGNTTGEVTPALTVAITRYQAKKGFVPTGRLDLQTCASLGLMKAPVNATPAVTPFVFADNGELRGPNGETLPSSVVAYRSSERSEIGVESAAEAEQIALASAGDDAAVVMRERRVSNARSRVPRRVRPHKETNPLMSAFHTIDHAIRVLVGDTQPKKKRTIVHRL